MAKLFDRRSLMGLAYLYYLRDRARIWAERYIDGAEPDYMGDRTLQTYHFCNVWRELDRYSRWEISNIRGLPLWHQLDVIVIGRYAMVPKTVELLLAGAPKREVDAYVARRRKAGLPWYSTALQIRAAGGGSYVDEFMEHRASYLRHRDEIFRIVEGAEDAQEIADALPRYVSNVGAFRGYEIATSLTYSEHLPHLHEDQLFTVGNGAVGGLEMLTGRRTSDRKTFVALRDEVSAALCAAGEMRWIPPEWQGKPGAAAPHKFTMRTLEDSLCEFRKYATLARIATGDTKASPRHYHRRDVSE